MKINKKFLLTAFLGTTLILKVFCMEEGGRISYSKWYPDYGYDGYNDGPALGMEEKFKSQSDSEVDKIKNSPDYSFDANELDFEEDKDLQIYFKDQNKLCVAIQDQETEGKKCVHCGSIFKGTLYTLCPDCINMITQKPILTGKQEEPITLPQNVIAIILPINIILCSHSINFKACIYNILLNMEKLSSRDIIYFALQECEFGDRETLHNFLKNEIVTLEKLFSLKYTTKEIKFYFESVQNGTLSIPDEFSQQKTWMPKKDSTQLPFILILDTKK